MAATSYQYSLATDFPNHVCAEDRLYTEITAAGITSAAYTHTSADDDTVSIWFDNPLSAGDQTLLDAVVAAHDGTALPGQAPNPVLGTQFQQVSEDGTSSTASSAWQDKVTLTTPSYFPAGTYFVQFYAEAKTSLTNNLVAVCCRHIDVADDEYLGAADFATAHDPADAEHVFGGFKIVSLLGGAHTFKIQYAQSKGSGTVSIRKARIALWRIS